MILLVGHYSDPHAARRAEFLECLRRNVANPYVQEIHVVLEDSGPTRELELLASTAVDKVRLVPHERRLTYQHLLTYANQHLAGSRVGVANADIFFDATLGRLAGCDLAAKLICLSRWDVQSDGSSTFFDHSMSQDAWIFQAPIGPVACDFPLGVLGCDNRFAWEAKHAGLQLWNPSRSVRAHHLHLTGVRRYGGRDRLRGPTASVAATSLAVPWVWFVVPCMGRLADLRAGIHSLVAQPRSCCLVVDYSCPEGTRAWVEANAPAASVLSVGGRTRFSGAEARNCGARAVRDPDAVMCFLDADHGVAEGFAEDILSRFSEDAFLVPDDSGPGFDSVLICGARTFAQVGGYDETFLDWGEETLDLRDTLRRAGLKARTFPASLLVPNKQSSNRSRWARVRSAETRQAIHAAIRRAKTAILAETGGIRPAGWREMYRVITAHHLAGRTDPVGVPHAVVAFRESMGYTIARLEAGASSHNNEGRPIVSVPPALRGLMFTQVVACRASPVEVEFRSAGRLYVLVGTDWEGCEPLRGALDDVAVREAMPALETAGGREFEVWSLHGEAGEHLTLPTQVMLVSSELHPVTFDVPELA